MRRFFGCRGCLSLIVLVVMALAFASIAARVPVWQTVLVVALALAWFAWRRADGTGDQL